MILKGGLYVFGETEKTLLTTRRDNQGNIKLLMNVFI